MASSATCFPMARIRKIVKEDSDIHAIAGEASIAVSIATEKFLELFALKGCEYVQRDKRKVLMYRDLARLVHDDTRFRFLEDVVPKTVSLNEAMKRQRKDSNVDQKRSDKKSKNSKTSSDNRQQKEQSKENKASPGKNKQKKRTSNVNDNAHHENIPTTTSKKNTPNKKNKPTLPNKQKIEEQQLHDDDITSSSSDHIFSKDSDDDQTSATSDDN